MSFAVLSHLLYHVPTTFFHRRHALTIGSSLKTEIYVGEFPHLKCKQLYRVSHFNSTEIAITSFLQLSVSPIFSLCIVMLFLWITIADLLLSSHIIFIIREYPTWILILCFRYCWQNDKKEIWSMKGGSSHSIVYIKSMTMNRFLPFKALWRQT